MADFQRYRRSQIAELRQWREGDDMSSVSVSAEDRKAGSPKPGDMIARNPKNHADQWLVAAAYFADNFEPLPAPAGDVGALVGDLISWLNERAKPDSGIDYEAASYNMERGRYRSARCELRGEDAGFVAEHFHGKGAARLATALTALEAKRATAEAEVARLRELVALCRDFAEAELAQRGINDADYPDHRRAGWIIDQIDRALTGADHG